MTSIILMTLITGNSDKYEWALDILSKIVHICMVHRLEGDASNLQLD